MWNKGKKTSLVTLQAAFHFHISRKQIVQNVVYFTIHRSFILNGIQKPKTGKRVPRKEEVLAKWVFITCTTFRA